MADDVKGILTICRDFFINIKIVTTHYLESKHENDHKVFSEVLKYALDILSRTRVFLNKIIVSSTYIYSIIDFDNTKIMYSYYVHVMYVVWKV
jgi:hypothetical protein